MFWTVAAPFFTKSNVGIARWLDDFVPSGKHVFKKIHASQDIRSWHNKSRKETTSREWFVFLKQGATAWNETADGCIAVFPQLAFLLGMMKRFSKKDKPLVAWCFNLGRLYSGNKKAFSRVGFRKIDKFIVHSKKECETVSRWFGFPRSKFEFVHLQRSRIPIVASEEKENPFILSMGTAHRDYETFLAAVGKLAMRTIIVTGANVLKGMAIPSNVEVLSGLAVEECHELAQRARVNVVPLKNAFTAAGQVTIVDLMAMSRPVVATRTIGSEDYVDHRKTGLLVNPGSISELTDAIAQLWGDEEMRTAIGIEAGKYAENNFSDEAAGRKLGLILDQF